MREEVKIEEMRNNQESKGENKETRKRSETRDDEIKLEMRWRENREMRGRS